MKSEKNFLDINYPFESADYVLLPVPYEVTTSRFAGTYNAPLRIIENSEELDDYIPEFEFDVKTIKIHTLPPLHPPSLIPAEAIGFIAEKVKKILDERKTPIIIGGEHTITLGVSEALPEDVRFVIIDAHLDFYHSFKGEKLCHATVGKRVSERHRILHIGARTYETSEMEDFMKGDFLLLPFKSFFTEAGERPLEECSRGKIYISVDLDVLSPSEGIPVGNPVGGEGFTVKELLSVLHSFILNCPVVGIDFCEYRPLPSRSADIIVSRIIQHALAFMEMARLAFERI